MTSFYTFSEYNVNIFNKNVGKSKLTVATTGGSILRATDAVEGMGAYVKKVLVIVDWEEGARKTLEGRGYEFFSIFKIGELL